MATIVRPYDAADLAACRALWEALTERHRQIYDDPTIGGADAGLWFDAHLARVGPTNIWVAEDAGEVVGMTGLIVGEGEAEVEPVVVAEAYRSRGIGIQLLDAAIAQARRLGVRYLNIGPVARNRRAIELFVRAGFGLIGHVQPFMELETPGEARPLRTPARTREEITALTEILEAWS